MQLKHTKSAQHTDWYHMVLGLLKCPIMWYQSVRCADFVCLSCITNFNNVSRVNSYLKPGLKKKFKAWTSTTSTINLYYTFVEILVSIQVVPSLVSPKSPQIKYSSHRGNSLLVRIHPNLNMADWMNHKVNLNIYKNVDGHVYFCTIQIYYLF